MADIFTPEKRSWIMSRIRGTNTKIDLRMEEMLQEIGYKFEMYPKMYGNPDFVLRSWKIIIFCDGDFWHGYKYFEKKKPSKKFWRDKIENNIKRDKRIARRLRREGWSVLRFWEHNIHKRPEKCEEKIIRKIVERKYRGIWQKADSLVTNSSRILANQEFLSKNNYFFNNDECFTLVFMNSIRKEIPKKSLPEFASLARVIKYNYVFLKKIVKRILDDVDANGKYWDAYYVLCDPNDEGLKLTEENKKALEPGEEVLEVLHLDVADFFIHSSIFLDQLCRVPCFFQKTNARSFSNHKKKIENQNFPSQYKTFVRKMSWFDEFKQVRDDFVVHPYNTFWGVSMATKGIESIGKMSFSKKKLAKRLHSLREKYIEIVGDVSYDAALRRLMINIEKLDDDDRTEVNNIQKFWGMDFPSIDFISDRIFDYMKAIEKNFKEFKFSDV